MSSSASGTAVAEDGAAQGREEGVVIRPYQPGDEAAINRGFNRAFGLQRPLEEWRWKFAAGPGEHSIHLALAPDGEVVAQFAALAVRVRVGERTVVAGHSVDAFCLRRSGLARRGLFARLAERFYAERCGAGGLAFLFGFPGERHLELGRAQLGYASPVPVPVWRRGLEEARRGWSRHRLREGFDPAAVDDLWRRAADRHPFSAVRDAAWLGRRYTGRPGVDYLHLGAFRHGRADAWAVLRLDGPVARWAELLWDGRDRRALAVLDAEAVRRAREAGAAGLEMWLAGDLAAAEAVARLGWLRGEHPQGLALTTVSFVPELGVERRLPSFYLALGDSDLV